MLAQGLISKSELEQMEQQIDAIVQEAIRFAEESPYPEPREALEDVFA
jgi:pyruvate dehydrogenase E1 component alpha subunit